MASILLPTGMQASGPVGRKALAPHHAGRRPRARGSVLHSKRKLPDNPGMAAFLYWNHQ